MASISFKDLEAVVMDAVDPEIVKQFERSNTLFERFSQKKDEHPWTSNLRVLANMLEGKINIPHKPKIRGKKCSVCLHAMEMQKKYKIAKANE